MNEELLWRIEGFFAYWRQRYEFICKLDLKESSHEANILTWAALDALSNLWASNVGKQSCSVKGKRSIFGSFLGKYGGETFQLVSLPDIWCRADQDLNSKKPELSKDLLIALSQIGNRRSPRLEDLYTLRHSSDDLSLHDLLKMMLQDHPHANPVELVEWIKLSRYGSIAYKEARNSYIHEGRPGKGSHSFELYESLIRPTYLSGIYTAPPVMGFAVEFMVTVLGRCIDAFEVEAFELQQDPVPYR